jgi:hypothetical protein
MSKKTADDIINELESRRLQELTRRYDGMVDRLTGLGVSRKDAFIIRNRVCYDAFPEEIDVDPQTRINCLDAFDRMLECGVPADDASRIVFDTALESYRYETGDYEHAFDVDPAKIIEAIKAVKAGWTPEPKPFPDWLDEAGDNWIDHVIPSTCFDGYSRDPESLIEVARNALNDLHHFGVSRKDACDIVNSVIDSVVHDWSLS